MSETWLLAVEGLVLLLLFLFVWAVARSSSRGLAEPEAPSSPPTSVHNPVVRDLPDEPPAAVPPARTSPQPILQTTPPGPVHEVGEATEAISAPVPSPSESGSFAMPANIRPRLVVEVAAGLPTGTEVELEGGVTIGRSSSSQLCLDDTYVSHMHARVFRRGPFFFIEDLGSTNGTFINGRRVDGQGQLKVHDEVRMGESVLRYEE